MALMLLLLLLFQSEVSEGTEDGQSLALYRKKAPPIFLFLDQMSSENV